MGDEDVVDSKRKSRQLEVLEGFSEKENMVATTEEPRELSSMQGLSHK